MTVERMLPKSPEPRTGYSRQDAGYACTECGSQWGGYHSWTFCRLKDLFGARYTEVELSRAAKLLDNVKDGAE